MSDLALDAVTVLVILAAFAWVIKMVLSSDWWWLE